MFFKMCDKVLNIPIFSGSPRQLISRLATQRSLTVGDSWTYYSHRTNTSELRMNYRVKCDQDYYGSGCTELCKARDDKFGHYRCNENGSKVCLDGWTGAYCDQGNYCVKQE